MSFAKISLTYRPEIYTKIYELALGNDCMFLYSL